MSEILTWHERAMEHPDHQSGMVSEDMIRARMAEEIADLRAHIDKTYALLKDPNVVAINMLRGVIAMPSVEQIRHIYQDRLLLPDLATVVKERDEARAEVERLHKAHQAACEGGDLLRAENARLRARIAEYFGETDTHPMEDA